MKIELKKTELKNLIVDLNVLKTLCDFEKIKLDSDRKKRIKQISTKLEDFYIEDERRIKEK